MRTGSVVGMSETEVVRSLRVNFAKQEDDHDGRSHHATTKHNHINVFDNENCKLLCKALYYHRCKPMAYLLRACLDALIISKSSKIPQFGDKCSPNGV